MAVSMQVIYPVGAETTFDFDYYLGSHFEIVGAHMGPYIESSQVVKGLAGGPDTPAGYHAIATLVFADKGAFDAAMKVAGPVMADVPNFTNIQPQVLIGEVVA